jgi:protein-S-isoprenylcysteine O-methyltransferase Ste14
MPGRTNQPEAGGIHMSVQSDQSAGEAGRPEPSGGTPASQMARPTAVLAIGPVRLTGLSAQLALFLLLAIAGVLVIHYRARILATPLTTSALLWVAFFVYWSVAATKAAPAVRSETERSRAAHRNLMLLAFVLLFGPLPWLDGRILPPGAIWVVVGLAVHVAAFGLAIAARRTLGRYWSAEITQKTDHELIRTGPYRFVRHPIYTAMIGMFFGTALVSGDLHAFLGAGVITVAYARKIRLEERNLADVFGPRYEEYRRTTRALIPWVL